MSTTLTIRLDDVTKNRLENLAKSTARSRSYLAAKAIEEYLEANEWQVAEIRDTLVRADSSQARFVDHAQVAGWLQSWGSKNEGRPPE
jgi:RHH-type transcriptional regulator, rel operon repressor / antitoxin RelB